MTDDRELTHPETLAAMFKAVSQAVRDNPLPKPLTQEETERLRDIMARLERVTTVLAALGWGAKWALWFIGTMVLLLSQWDSLRTRFWP